MRVLFLGTGTSVGIPQIGCDCTVCTSSDPRNKRTRPSVLIEIDGRNHLIDIGHDFRAQMIQHSVSRLDAILLTHSHADHVLGIDDLRSLNAKTHAPIPVFATQTTFDSLRRTLFYVFEENDDYTSRPAIEPITFDNEPFEVGGVTIQPIEVNHGKCVVHGFRFGRFAYITDAKRIPAKSVELLRGVEVLVLNALRFTPHPTHFSVDEACEAIRKIAPRVTYLTHIGHGIDHEPDSLRLPPGVHFAYDGLELQPDA